MNKRSIRLAHLIPLTFLLLTIPAFGRDYFVSTQGDDAAPGTREQSLRTIQAASNHMQAGDICKIQGGMYRELFVVNASGESDAPIRFEALNGDNVVLSGCEILSPAWTTCNPNKDGVRAEGIFRAKVPDGVRQLFVNGRMMVEARWPNQPIEQRWDKSTWAANDEGSDYGLMRDEDLAPTGIDWTGAEAVLNVGGWQTFLRIVENHDVVGDSFRYARDMGRRYDSEQTQRWRRTPDFDHYFLMGTLDALDAPCEWYYDESSETLYFLPPPDVDMSDCVVERKVRDYAVVVQDQSNVALSGLQFFATTFLFDDVEHCVIENCELEYPTFAGRRSTNESDQQSYIPESFQKTNAHFLGSERTLAPTLIAGRDNTVRNCVVRFSETAGLILTGEENTVENCLVQDVDWRGLGNGALSNCAGVYMAGSARSTFRRNSVSYVGSSEGVVLPRHGPFLCELNYIHHGGLVQCDGGLIQCSGINLNGSLIRYNWTHTHDAFHWGGIGIRGDDLTRNLLVHHNVVWDCAEKGIMIKGDQNAAYNNTCFGNRELDLILWASPEPYKEWSPSQWEHLVERQNENSEAANNYAPVLTGQMRHEIRREKQILPPLASLDHNITEGPDVLVDARTYHFEKPDPPLNSPECFDFRPARDSILIDAGRIVDGITEPFEGEAPDVGAYEYGSEEYWIPGRLELQASAPTPSNGSVMRSQDVMLAWRPALDAVAYRIAFSNGRDKIIAVTENNTYLPGTLAPGQELTWTVDVVLQDGTLRHGDEWTFTYSPQIAE